MEKNIHREPQELNGRWIREFILGSQDGLVNVLGLILGVATATNDVRVILIAGIAALFAESISMGAVAYTSSKAAHDYYLSMVAREKREVDEIPHEEVREVHEIYHKKGFRGKLLHDIVKKITSNKKLWVDTMMAEELKIFPDQSQHPGKVGWVVFTATVIGSIIPIIPFFFFSVKTGTITSMLFSIAALFGIGVVKAKVTTGSWKRAGAELAVIGFLAACAGYVIGKILEIVFIT